MDKKKKIILGVLGFILVIAIFFINNYINSNSNDDNEPIHGKIISENIKTSKKETSNKKTKAKNNKNSMKSKKVAVKITTGDHKGQIIYVDNLINDKTYDETTAHTGDDVLLSITENDNGSIKSSYIYELDRYEYIYMLFFAFAILLIIIGGKKGLKAVATLIFTALAIFKIMVPLIVSGANPILVSVILCIGISIINLLIISGKNKKTFAAIIGTIGGVLIAAVIAAVLGSKLNLTGMTDEEIQMMIYIVQNADFNFRGLMFAGILMGALGAVMDVSMSIASSINEIKEHRPESSVSELIKSGMNIGKDIMGTMSNTLILAYVGSSMYIIMLVYSYKLPLYRMLDQDAIASAALSTLSGSIGLICTIPVTAVVSALLFNIDKKQLDSDDKKTGLIDKN
ncbi:MAG: YibE/F family protein [Clostridium sp.]|nr:YibE/F family protein [Clostridium sp.]